MSTDCIIIDADAPSSATPEITKPAADKVKTDSPLDTNEAFNWQKTDSLKFAFQILLTLILLGFCIGKMTVPDKNNDSAYWGAITSLIAWWMPSPGNGKPAAKPDAK